MENSEKLIPEIIDGRSDEVQEILGFIPHWIVRWGISIITTTIIILLVGSWFFKYPDIINSTIVVTTENPPASIVARVNGKIQHLFVEDHQLVEKEIPLAMLENTATYQHVFQLKEKLTMAKQHFGTFNFEDKLHLREDPSLGELQSVYEIFLKQYGDYQHFLKLKYYDTKIRSLSRQIEQTEIYILKLSEQKKILEEEFQVAKKQIDRSGTLFKDGIISQSQYDDAKSIFLQKKHSVEGAGVNMANSRIRLSQLEESIQDLNLQKTKENSRLQLDLKQAFDNLYSQTLQWEQKYILKSPIKGTVSFTIFWSQNQNVKSGDTVMTIVPETTGNIVGNVILPIAGSGKVKVGQTVHIKFSNYPYLEFGLVKGIIRSRSLVPSNKFYSLKVELPDGLKTNYGRVLKFQQEMQGDAQIITEDVRLLQRVLRPLKSLIKRQSPEQF